MKNLKKGLAHDNKLSIVKYSAGGGEDIPAGGWRGGGEDIPAGGWRGGGEDIPAGGWRWGGEDIPAGGWRLEYEMKTAGRLISPFSTLLYEEDPSFSENIELIPPGSFRAVVDVYRTTDGGGFFKFRFYQIGDYYEIDILAMPSYGTRESGPHTTHRLTSSRGGYKICFGDPRVVTTLSLAKQWAAIWSEHTMNYIKYGRSFPNS